MKRIMIAVVGVLAVAAGVEAQSAAQTIQQALAPLPERAREGATVIRWNADHTYETLKEGTNTWVCYDRSGEPGRAPFAVQCTHRGNLERLAQNRMFEEEQDREARQRMLDEAERNGTRVQPVYGSMWIAMNGQDMESAGIHTTIAVPGATSESTGFPSDRASGGAYIMAEGTSTAHIMIPGR